VLRLLDARLSHAEIAEVLHTLPSTVQGHASDIYRKLTVRTRGAAVAQAHGLRLLPPRTP
jgi:ATP/maltotriose-dependent transcriptional regulator MalT